MRERERECVCEMNLTGEEKGIVPSWSVDFGPVSGSENFGQNLQFS